MSIPISLRSAWMSNNSTSRHPHFRQLAFERTQHMIHLRWLVIGWRWCPTKVVLALGRLERLIEAVHIVEGADLFCHPTITDVSEVASRRYRLRVHRAPHRLDDNRLTKVLDVRVEF